MKKNIGLGIVLIAFVSIAVVLFLIQFFNKKYNYPLEYEYKQSYHNNFYAENGYVVFEDSIKIKNTTSKDLAFYMTANVSEDIGLVTDGTATACNKDTLEKELFFIKANSEQIYSVHFKAEKGDYDKKLNRLPPKKIIFEIAE